MTRKGNDLQVSNSNTHATGYILCVEKTGSEFVLPIWSPGLPKMGDDPTGSVREVCTKLLSQSIAIDEWFLCGY